MIEEIKIKELAKEFDDAAQRMHENGHDEAAGAFFAAARDTRELVDDAE